jgi:hypothetical protein
VQAYTDLPRAGPVRFADPAAIIATQATRGHSPEDTGTSPDECELERENTGLHAFKGSAGDGDVSRQTESSPTRVMPQASRVGVSLIDLGQATFDTFRHG